MEPANIAPSKWYNVINVVLLACRRRDCITGSIDAIERIQIDPKRRCAK